MKKFVKWSTLDSDAASFAAGVDCGDESFVQPQFAKECDINEIVRRFGITGTVPVVEKMPLSGDFVAVSDFHSAMNLVKEAEAEFMRQPAEIRARFGNDAGAFIAFFEDDRNRPEAEALGLVKKKDEPRQEPAKKE